MVFSKKQTLSQRPLEECPPETIPSRLHPYLLESGEEGETVRLNAGRYEFWLYRQIRKRFLSDEIYLNDSLRHRHLSDELVAEGEQSAILAEMKIPFLQKSIKTQLKALSGELHRQWKAFNCELKQGKLKHLKYDTETTALLHHREEGGGRPRPVLHILSRFFRKYFGSNNFSAINIDDHIEIKMQPLNSRWDITNIPAPHLVGGYSFEYLSPLILVFTGSPYQLVS